MSPRPRRFCFRKRNSLGINYAPKAPGIFKLSESSSERDESKFAKSIKKYYPYIIHTSNSRDVQVFVWNTLINVPSEFYDNIIKFRHPHTFYCLERRQRSRDKDFDCYLYSPRRSKRYRSVPAFEGDHKCN